MRRPTFCAHVNNHDDGITITVMERSGRSMGALSIYNDNITVGFISQVHTEDKHRNLGLANRVLYNLEEIGKNRGVTTFQLAVEKSWAVDWYKRHGYNQYTEYEDTNYVGMEKKVDDLSKKPE